jgi:sigma-B regulation protein RsbQ
LAAAPITKNQVRSAGTGEPALVFGHGFGTDQRAWRFVAPAFEARHRTVLFDHVGFGGSNPGAYDESRHKQLDGYAQDLIELLDALGLRQVVYVGHSVGGVLGLLASIVRPDLFARLVLIGSSPRFINDPPGYMGGFEAHEIEAILDLMERDQLSFAQTLAPLAMGTQSAAPLVDDFSRGLQQLDPLVARRFGRLVFGMDCRSRLAQVTVPALVLQCLHDSIAPRQVGRYLHQHLAGSRLLELDASGHCPHLSHPQQTIAAIAGFVDAPHA